MRSFVFNEVMKIRRETLIELAKSFMNGSLSEDLPKIPKKIISEEKDNVYLEREVLKQKIKIYLGLDYEKTKDIELYEIANDIEKYISKGSEYLSGEKHIQIIKEACDKCPSGRYYVTDLCRNCLAHSCYNSCPKKAISIDGNKSVIDPEKCIGCGLCAKACEYYAIVKLQRPCENSCAVNAIGKDENFAADLDYEKCVTCGACFTACPFGAIESSSDFYKVLESLANGEEITAMIAPSIVSQFGPKASVGQIKNAVEKIGFTKCVEVAVAADEVAEEEAQIAQNIEEGETLLTSCCPAFVSYVKKYQKDFSDKISHIPSPMIVMANNVKKENPKTKTLFIGPCLAKKREAAEKVDFVLTYEELGALFIANKIEPTKYEEVEIDGSQYGWNFAFSGGVTQALDNITSCESCMKMNGLKEGKEVFNLARKEHPKILEGMACEGGCIAGPGITVNPRIALNNVKRVIKKKEVKSL